MAHLKKKSKQTEIPTYSLPRLNIKKRPKVHRFMLSNLYGDSLHSLESYLIHGQYDQMDRLFLQCLAIYNIENLPNSI